MGRNQAKTSKESLVSVEKTKVFNKSKWRENKYSHKAKYKHFEERRKKAVIHRYYKDLKKNEQHSSFSSRKSTNSKETDVNSKRNRNAFQLTKEELNRRAQQKEQLKQERERLKAEKQEAIMKYKKEKIRKSKLLNKKTKRGQPVMAGRMELLLEKIKKSVEQNCCVTL